MAQNRLHLSDGEREAIVTGVKSAFTKLKNLYEEIQPIIVKYGFTLSSAGVVARDLSEKIETAIVQHCSVLRNSYGRAWVVRI